MEIKVNNILTIFVWVIVLLIPLILYSYIFGTGLSTKSQEWANFGSAMSGIYAPILSIFTLVLLVLQLRMQAKLNTHEYDQAYIGQGRADIEFYLNQLQKAVDEQLPNGETFRQVLIQKYQSVSKV